MSASHSKTHTRILPFFLTCFILVVALVSSPQASGESLEYTVKASYIYKFGDFIEWPASAFEAATSPTTICVVGEDPVGPVLDQVVDGHRIGERAIVVRRLKTVSRDSGCHILFVGDSDTQSASKSLEAVHGTNVLTITDAASKSEATGIINFVVRDDRVRFEIDDQAAAENGLTISSKLLSLAMSTKPRN